jgi:hypothetical protein
VSLKIRSSHKSELAVLANFGFGTLALANKLDVTPAQARSRSPLGGKAKLSDLLQRLEVKEADLGCPAYVQGHDDPAIGNCGGIHVGALGQKHGAINDGAGSAFAAIEKAIADDADHRGNSDRSRQRRYDHQPTRTGECGAQILGCVGLFGWLIGLIGFVRHDAHHGYEVDCRRGGAGR